MMAGSSPSLPDGSNPSAAIVQSASDVQCSRLLKTTTVVVHSMDRLARNLDDLRRLVQKLTQRGVRIEFLKEG
ncbi:recombinase family protein, partial [Klebsiella pneumoniae]